MTDFYTSKVTIYSNIEATAETPRSFSRFVLKKCQITGQIVDKANDTIRNIFNATTVVSKDIKKYKRPLEYIELPEELREGYFTVQVGDIVVLGEVDDIVTNAKEMQDLQRKYEGKCIKATSVGVYINGMATDNITITNA